MDTDLPLKMQQVIDRSEILAVINRCARGNDRWDADLIRSCYFEDAVDDHGDDFVGNVEGLVEYVKESARGFVASQHMVCNHHCELDGDDAYAETYFLVFCLMPQAPHIVSAGRYIDHFQRRAGEWRILTRAVVMENNYETTNSSLYPIVPASQRGGDAHKAARDRSDVSYQRPVPRRPLRENWRAA